MGALTCNFRRSAKYGFLGRGTSCFCERQPVWLLMLLCRLSMMPVRFRARFAGSACRRTGSVFVLYAGPILRGMW